MPSIVFEIARICHSQFKFNYLKNEKILINFLFHFWNLHQIIGILKGKMIVIANVFPKLETVKIHVRPLSKKRRFRRRFDSQHVEASQILAKSTWRCFYHVSLSFPGKLISKMYTLVIGKILRVFDKYRVQDCENLPLPIQMQLSEKRKTFSEFCVPFLQSASNFKSFE